MMLTSQVSPTPLPLLILSPSPYLPFPHLLLPPYMSLYIVYVFYSCIFCTCIFPYQMNICIYQLIFITEDWSFYWNPWTPWKRTLLSPPYSSWSPLESTKLHWTLLDSSQFQMAQEHPQILSPMGVHSIFHPKIGQSPPETSTRVQW